jgi:antitoxin (DNA-binding transcriptional repressor) of toxin-antitoxin stability system
MEHIINLKAFREDTGKYLDQIEKGKTFVVFKRSKPVFKITPIDDEGQWKTLIDFTKIRKGGIPVEKLVDLLKK